ncbi:MAG TPA: bifunctional phosphoribosyl-AMP cyclohydrolase/phosphoribosyl-ATP diphosphatase HisIE [Alphaproteobacteria bacterium]|nr:bifunctional phosphoribosyl-AMP cyclohydrolase/phosphoribosyl-ATP diphosphatase HisIE [Alphaproteobacteria bacterium]HNS44580.1 bifunctional phosphoribosyl-AMP cyclohydrolase/phosphoribosyl-ATP diphosphatase HisIE [Alphaproteobacteria bacterium]
MTNLADKIDWQKVDGMIPAIVQDTTTRQVLMLGYMNREALNKTLATRHVTFFSRTRQELWTKGETSGNILKLENMYLDCDSDTLLVLVKPAGPTCHTGTISCFDGDTASPISFLSELSNLIAERNKMRPANSYTTKLFESGRSRISQKVGEEGVELALAHMKDDKDEILNETADLLFHTTVLLENAGLSLDRVCEVLKSRHTQKESK